MTIRHLDALFDPASVAVIGTSPLEDSLGAIAWRKLRDGGFTGPRFAVDPERRSIDGEPAHASVQDLPAVPQLALLCTPAPTLPALIGELARLGTRAAIVVTPDVDAATTQAMLDAARPSLLRIVGPGGAVLSPPRGLDASLAPVAAAAGSTALVTPSRALLHTMLDWARGRGIGFSRAVALGAQADVDAADLLDWLASDSKTRSILLHAEAFGPARKFMSAARAAARNKPVLVVKADREAGGRDATRDRDHERDRESNAGALADHDRVADAAIRRAGMLRVPTLQDLFVAAETLAHLPRPPRWMTGQDLDARARVSLFGNGSGPLLLAADALARSALEPSGIAPRVVGDDAAIEQRAAALSSLLETPGSGTVLLLHAPGPRVASSGLAEALLASAAQHPGRLVACWLGGDSVAAARQRFREAGIPCYDTPEQAVLALAGVATYRHNQEQLLEAPPARPAATGHPPFDADALRRIVDASLAAGCSVPALPDALALVAACGIPVVPTQRVDASPHAAAAAARRIGYPVLLKIAARGLVHENTVGGVALGLADGRAVRSAAAAMLERVAALRPDIVVEGLVVQPMLRRPGAVELIAGTTIDPGFGPVLLFGAGGSAAQIVRDRAVALPPLNAPLARELIGRTRIKRLLAGNRHVAAADAAKLEEVLTRLSRLLAEEPRIAQLDIDPLLADAQGVIALDARVRLDASGPGGAARFAIRPYPDELIERFRSGGREITLRPIRPEDEAQHLAFLEKVDPADIRMRVFYARRSIERSELARLVQIDYEREMAFVATAALAPPDDDRSPPAASTSGQETLAAARAITGPDNAEAEFGILVRSDLKGAGLGRRLMTKLIDYQRSRGTHKLVATVLPENEAMLALAKALGFVHSAAQPDPDVVHIELALNAPDST